MPTTEKMEGKIGRGMKIYKFCFFNMWSLGHVREIYIKTSSKKKSIYMDLNIKIGRDSYIQDRGL